MKSLKAIFIALLVLQGACAKTTQSGANAKTVSTQSNSTQSAPPQYPNAKTQANLLTDAILAGDYAKAADLTYPKLVELSCLITNG